MLEKHWLRSSLDSLGLRSFSNVKTWLRRERLQLRVRQILVRCRIRTLNLFIVCMDFSDVPFSFHVKFFEWFGSLMELPWAIMAGLESWPAFQARALEIQMTSDFLDALKVVGIDSFGKLAFICAANPASGDDAPLRNAVETLLGSAVDEPQMIPLRRLWFERHAIASSDMKARLERTASDTPRQMPLAERMSRLKRQKDELKSLQSSITFPG